MMTLEQQFAKITARRVDLHSAEELKSRLAKSIAENDALRTSSRLRTTVFTSTLVVASAMQATCRSTPPRLPVTSTQLADVLNGSCSASQRAAVSANAGSIANTRALGR